MHTRKTERPKKESANYAEIERISPEFDECGASGHTLSDGRFLYDVCFCGAYKSYDGMDRAIDRLEPYTQYELV